MQQEIEQNYCQHFQHFKSIKKITLESRPFCKFCLSTNCSLWLCLHKNCGLVVCSKSNFMHLASHMEESKKTKSFHSIFINVNTAQIRCQYCGIQIIDIDKLNEEQRKKIMLNSQSNNPLKFRTAILPFLEDLGHPKIQGQLQYPQGHRKINKGLVGIFADRQNYSVIPAVQFIAHCDFFKLKQNRNNKNLQILSQLKNITQSIQEARQRAIWIDKFMQLIKKRHPKLTGYSRKDPFQSILDILNLLHQQLNFYRVINPLSNLGKDEWDLYYKSKQIQSHCPIYDSLSSTLSLNYKCTACGSEQNFNHQINFVKLEFPKKRKKAKAVEQQLNQKGYESPRKRGKSLMSLILPEQDLPITIPQLLIQFFKQPFHKDRYCSKCKNFEVPMKPGKVQFKKIGDILILQINRMPKGTDQINDTSVLMNFESLNLSPFLVDNSKNSKNNKQEVNQNQTQSQKQMNYQLVTAMGIQNGMFPIICKNKYNNQMYTLKNQSIEMMTKKTNFNPYVICLKRRTSIKTAQFYQQIILQNQAIVGCSPEKNDHKNEKQTYNKITLPDFYHIQLKYGIQLPVFQPLVCKHSKIKPLIQRKSEQNIVITQQTYQQLINTFKGNRFINQVCNQCQQEIKLIHQRKSKQKQLIKDYDSFKTNCNVMIAIAWLKKWSSYLYSSDMPSYFHKGYPLPPPIDNTVLLENNKCKANLVKNRDFKVVNIFVFKLLKELYSGGPQIRYKWKNHQLGHVDEATIREIKNQAVELKSIYCIVDIRSPRKSVILQKSSSYMETVNQTEMEDDFGLQQKN